MKHYLLLFTCLFLAFFTACDKVNVETGGNPVKPDTLPSQESMKTTNTISACGIICLSENGVKSMVCVNG